MVFVWLWSGVIHANTEVPVISVNEALNTNINELTTYLEDKKSNLTIQDIIQQEHEWLRPSSKNVITDLPKTTFWVRLVFDNPRTSPKDVVLEFNPIFLEHINLYNGKGDLLVQTGSTVAQKKVAFFPTLDFTVPSGSSTKYLSITSRSNALSMIMRSKGAQLTKNNFDLAVSMFLTGGLVVLLIYHFFMFLSYTNSTFLLYSLFLSSAILFTVSFTSLHHFLLPGEILGFRIDFWWSAITAPFFLLAHYLFSTSILGVSLRNKAHSRLAKVLLLIPAVNIACILGIILTENAHWLIGVRLAPIISLALLMGSGVYLWVKDRSNTIPLYYSLSWAPFAVSVVTVVLTLAGVLNYREIYAWAIPIGVVLQSVLLSFTLGKKQKDIVDVIESFAGSDIVDEIHNGLDPLKFQPVMKDKNIVFFDLREFTSLAEKMAPLELRNLLNTYFSPIISNTQIHGGKVEKIIGDALMLSFDDPNKCLDAIVATRYALSELNRDRVGQGHRPIRFGTAIASGQVLLANFGSRFKIDRTVAGDIVNTASRLEGTTKDLAVDILCTKEFLEKLTGYDFYRPVGYVLFKGKTRKSLVYELFEHNVDNVRKWKISTREKLYEAVETELNADYRGALNIINNLIKKCPDHTHPEKDMIMDPTLHAIVKAINDKLSLLGIKLDNAA